ncbi:hypothetical protein JCM1841_003755 [Sporobolomyces salmonicolor]
MPIKRLAEDTGRPPLTRGSACSRCYKRKVRCSGQPDPASGFHSCDSCRRTARYKGHDIYQARCSFNREGLCSEEGGPTLSGEVYSNAGPSKRVSFEHCFRSGGADDSSTSAPGRKTSSRHCTMPAMSSRRSIPSGSSTSAADYSPPPSKIPSSVGSIPTRTGSSFGRQALEHFPSPSETFKLPPPIPSQPSPVPLSAPSLYPHNTAYASPPSYDSPHPPPGSSSHSSASQHSLLARRAHLQPLHIALPPPPSIVSSSSVPSSAIAGPSHLAASISAPLQAPNDWGRQHPSFYLSSQDYPQQHYPPSDFNGVPPSPVDGARPLTSLALDLAPLSALTPSTLAKLDLSPFPTYDYATAPVPSLGFGSSNEFPRDPRSTPSFPSSSHPALQPSGPRAPDYDGFAAPAAAAGSELAGLDPSHPAPFSNSFHLPSPGLTFSSSTPPWLSTYGQGQYFRN